MLAPHFSEPCWPAPGGRGWRARPEQMAPRTLGCLLACFRTHFGVWCLKKVILVLRKKSQSIMKNGINFGDGVKPTGAGDAPGACAVMVPAALAGPVRSPWLPRPYSCSRSVRPARLTSCRPGSLPAPQNEQTGPGFNRRAEAGWACPGAGGADPPYFQPRRRALARSLPQ